MRFFEMFATEQPLKTFVCNGMRAKSMDLQPLFTIKHPQESKIQVFLEAAPCGDVCQGRQVGGRAGWLIGWSGWSGWLGWRGWLAGWLAKGTNFGLDRHILVLYSISVSLGYITI